MKPSKRYHKNGTAMLEVLAFAKRYNAWIAESILPYIITPALEIGAGKGNITHHIVRERTPLVISDADSTLVYMLRNKFKKERDVSICQLDIERAAVSRWKGYFATIYAVNVLEHIDDDENALTHIRTMLQPDGKIILLVPANRFAYTKLDAALGHVRRYEKQELVAKLEHCGFTVETIRYFNLVGLVSWFVRDFFDVDHTHLTPFQVAVFEGIIPILKAIESRITIPIGISLIAVAKARV